MVVISNSTQSWSLPRLCSARIREVKWKKILDEIAGDFQVLLEVSEGDPSVHDHGLPRMAWTRAVRLMT